MDTITFMGKDYRRNSAGYWRNRSNKATNRLLHREVYKHYFGSIPKGFQVHHIDGDKDNNHIENLIALPAREHALVHKHLEKYRDERWNIIKEKLSKETIACRECSKKVIPTNTHQKFCSHNCTKRYNTKHKRARYVCQVCHQDFMGNRYTKPKTCSRECANKLTWATRGLRNTN